jgi:glycosyltransferase involved in cell wall biosynthesis
MRRRVLYVQYANPALYPAVAQSATILADRGWEARFLGVRIAGAADVAMPPHPRVALHLMPCAADSRRMAHYLRFAAWSAAWALRWRPGWIYVSDPLAAPAGLLAGAVPGARLVYHEHDAPAPGDRDRPDWTTRVVLAGRRRLARRACIRVAPNARRAELLVRECQADGRGRALTACVWNCPRRDEALGTLPDRRGQPLLLHYHGTLNRFRLPPALLEGMALVRQPVGLRVVGYETLGHPGFADQFLRRARALTLGARVSVMPPVPRPALLGIARDADVGVAMVSGAARDPNLVHLPGASVKAFDYLACGLPLIVPDTPEWRRLYVEPGYAMACDPDSPEDVAAVLRWFATHRDEARAMGQRGRRRILEEWNYETQFAPVLRAMENRAA